MKNLVLTLALSLTSSLAFADQPCGVFEIFENSNCTHLTVADIQAPLDGVEREAHQDEFGSSTQKNYLVRAQDPSLNVLYGKVAVYDKAGVLLHFQTSEMRLVSKDEIEEKSTRETVLNCPSTAKCTEEFLDRHFRN